MTKTDGLYELWLKNVKDEKLLKELGDISENSCEKRERFYKDIEFGTAGLRGIMGAGTNRINIYTVRLASQGLANYLNEKYVNPKVVISFDSRKDSRVFALETAKVMAGNNIKAYVTRELAPTPFLSFCVRHLNASAGIMITASHNTAEYNGYKCYGSDGAQMSEAPASEVYSQMQKTDIFKDVKTADLNHAEKNNLFSFVSDDVYEDYLNYVVSQRINKVSFDNLKIVYTPLCGAGSKFVKKVFEKIKAKNFYVVPEQENPDENFSSCPKPNPELWEAFSVSEKAAVKKGADIIIATDPDSDRLGVCVKTESGFKLLSGNEIGIILFNYIVNSLKSKGTFPKNPVAVKTIVSSPMINIIAKEHNCAVKEVLTGFKNIASEILSLEKFGRVSDYVFGFEESNGYLFGAAVRDKDAVSASLLICEAAAYYLETEKKNLCEIFCDLQKKYGFNYEKTLSFEFEGYEGKFKIENMIKTLRTDCPLKIENKNALEIEDYSNSTVKQPESGKILKKDLPKSDVLAFRFSPSDKIIVRPSGTEPKIKFYIMVMGESETKSKFKGENAEKSINSFINFFK